MLQMGPPRRIKERSDQILAQNHLSLSTEASALFRRNLPAEAADGCIAFGTRWDQ